MSSAPVRSTHTGLRSGVRRWRAEFNPGASPSIYVYANSRTHRSNGHPVFRPSSQHTNLETLQTYQNLADELLQQAKKKGVTQIEVGISRNIGFSVTVRAKDVEIVEHARNKMLEISVYFDQRKGVASSSDLSSRAVENTLEAACHIANFSNPDPCAGLADPHLLEKSPPDLDLYYPWLISPQEATELGKECEEHALAADQRIAFSEGVILSTYENLFLYANSNGFMGYYPSSRHSISCNLVAKDGESMQRDGDYTISRDPSQLTSVTKLAQQAADATLQRLSARRPTTCQAPIIFHAPVASSLIRHFLAAISGKNLYRKASFLVDHLDEPLFSDGIFIQERPHLLKGLGSAPFDDEGVSTRERMLVSQGVLQGYLLDSYSARKLRLQTTGNAGGAHNILVKGSPLSLEDLIKKMDTGLLVTELLGQGVNLVTGDYSRGAVGLWIERGQIQYPVEEVTIAGNLRDIYRNIIAVADDIDVRSTTLTGSILVERMTIAGGTDTASDGS